MSTTVRVEDMIAAAATAFGITYRDITSDRRTRRERTARMVAMYTVRMATGLSYPMIGKAFGSRDHTTVMHSVRTIEEKIQTDPSLAALVNSLIQAAEYRELVVARGTVNVLGLARQIIVNPRRAAISASTYEVVALGKALIDLWEVASAAEVLAADVEVMLSQDDDSPAALRMRALAGAIRNELCVLAGEPEPEAEPAPDADRQDNSDPLEPNTLETSDE